MDGIQPYTGSSRTPASAVNAVDPTQVKTPSDYLRALRRRIWLVLAVGVPLSVLVAVAVVRQQNVYRAMTEIMIEPPQFDPTISALLDHEIGQRDPDFTTRYVPNRIAMLKSRALAEEALNDPALAQTTPAGEDAAQDLINNLATKQITGSNRFQVTLDGTDPARTAKTLLTLLERFRTQAADETVSKNDVSKSWATTSLNTLKKELADLDAKIYDTLGKSKTIGPGGKSIVEERYTTHGATMLQKKAQLGEFQRNLWLSEMFPNFRNQGDPAVSGKLDELEQERVKLMEQGQLLRQRFRPERFNSDPAVKHLTARLSAVIKSIDRLRASASSNQTVNPTEALVASIREEIHADELTAQNLLKELQESMPEHQRFLNLLEDREQKQRRIDQMTEKLGNFEILARSQKSPVTIPDMIGTPGAPVRPKRALMIALGIIVSFGLGIALVCLLEHLDHSVKVPEHLSMGLTLPLFGVVPRIRRTALVHRGGHLWMGNAPESIEADAYRNLRASLIGSSARHGPIVTLLVTSAKAGEGKSTTALNLAATCARAGERTLLMDVDLRRPSLAGVFREDDEPNLGLVDVLRGDLPWQRTVVRTDIPNLDFLPTGDTRDIPIEILGTIELRQLILALSHHYDRVILDGPAVLGLPDCRMLGAFVDAALLVVRSGSHGLRPLKRAKAFLEQSNVVLSGVVFNGLYEDLENWSSYGPNTPYGYPEISGEARTLGPAGGLAAPTDEPHAALTAAGSARI